MIEGAVWTKIFLILALHGSANFDAWSTNRLINHCGPGSICGEGNPIYRPFAGRPTMYLAVNLAVVPLDVLILRGKRKRAVGIIAISAASVQGAFALRNLRLYDHTWNLALQRAQGGGRLIPIAPDEAKRAILKLKPLDAKWFVAQLDAAPGPAEPTQSQPLPPN